MHMYDGQYLDQILSLCKENKVISLEVKEGLWYFFSTIGEDCRDLLYFERVNVIEKINHETKISNASPRRGRWGQTRCQVSGAPPTTRTSGFSASS